MAGNKPFQNGTVQNGFGTFCALGFDSSTELTLLLTWVGKIFTWEKT
jgi:hypothetical protein